MDAPTALETNTQTTEVMQPGMSALDHPTVLAQTAATFGSTFSNDRLDAAFAQLLAMWFGVIAAIGIDGTRLLQRSATHAPDRRNDINQGQQLRDVVGVRASQDGGNRDAVGVGCDVVLGFWSRAIRGVRARFSPAPTARIDEYLTTTREKSI